MRGISLLRYPGEGGGSSGETVVANNGLSMFAGAIELGQPVSQPGDPGQLIRPTEIPFNGQFLTFVDRISGDTIVFGNPTPTITLNVTASDWSSENPEFRLVSNSGDTSQFHFKGTHNLLFSDGDEGLIQLQTNSGGSTQTPTILLTASGNFLIYNANTATPSSDSGDLIQAYGSIASFNPNGNGDIVKIFSQSFSTNPSIVISVNNSSWASRGSLISLENNNSNFQIIGDTGSDINSGLSGDVGVLAWVASPNLTNLIFNNTGNLILFNQTFGSNTILDSGYVFQVLGNFWVNNALSDAITPTLHIQSQLTQDNQAILSMDALGTMNLNSIYGESNGGNFQAALNLNQQILFNSPSESQQNINLQSFVNWQHNTLGNMDVIAFNEIQLQFNLNAVGDPNPAQLTIGSDSSYYATGFWIYRGMNPMGGDGTGNLVITTGGAQTGTAVRPLPLSGMAIRTDFNNGNTVNVTGLIANYVSDLACGAAGSVQTFIDYSAGGGFNNPVAGFTVTNRIAFWAQDLTDSVNVTNGYAFLSEGVKDLSYLAGRMQIGGTRPTSISALLKLAPGGTLAGSAPFKLTSSAGGLLATPEDGAWEYDGTHLYFTIGATRHTIV